MPDGAGDGENSKYLKTLKGKEITIATPWLFHLLLPAGSITSTRALLSASWLMCSLLVTLGLVREGVGEFLPNILHLYNTFHLHNNAGGYFLHNSNTATLGFE